MCVCGKKLMTEWTTQWQMGQTYARLTPYRAQNLWKILNGTDSNDQPNILIHVITKLRECNMVVHQKYLIKILFYYMASDEI